MKLFLFFLCCMTLALPAAAHKPLIVTTIKPLHSLVLMVAGDSARVEYLVKEHQSPHGLALTPSQLQLIHKADIVFMIDPALESFMVPVGKTLDNPDKLITLGLMRHMMLLRKRDPLHLPKYREVFNNTEGSQAQHDPHIWLNVANAQMMVGSIANVLAQQFPEQIALYQQRELAAQQALQALHEEMDKKLQPLEEVPYLVFHDAYQYLEKGYGLGEPLILSLQPEMTPPASHISRIKAQIHKEKIACVFSEPQFSDKLVKLVVGGNSKTRVYVLDPLGSHLAEGEGMYPEMMRSITQQMAGCLQKQK